MINIKISENIKDEVLSVFDTLMNKETDFFKCCYNITSNYHFRTLVLNKNLIKPYQYNQYKNIIPFIENTLLLNQLINNDINKSIVLVSIIDYYFLTKLNQQFIKNDKSHLTIEKT